MLPINTLLYLVHHVLDMLHADPRACPQVKRYDHDSMKLKLLLLLKIQLPN